MTTEHDDKLTGLLAQAVQQLVETPQANDLPVDLDADVLRELLLADASPGDLSSTAGAQRREQRRMPLLAKYSLAASLLILAGAVAWLNLAGGTNSAYGAVAERLGKLRSIVYRSQWVSEAGLVNVVAGDGDKVTHLAPSHDRIERSNGSVLVIDTDIEKAIDLNPATKTALVMNGQLVSGVAMLSRDSIGLIDTLRKHFRVGRTLPEGVEKLEEKEIDGIQATGWRSTIDGEVVEAWIDPNTDLPLEVRIGLVIPAHLSGLAYQPARMLRIISNLEYDVAVDRSLMSVAVPAGYTVIQMPELSVAKSTAASSLTDLIDLLRLCAQHNDSTFPDSLTINDLPGSCMAIMKRFADAQQKLWESGTDAEKQAALKAAMGFGAAMGRVTPFLFSLKPENKLCYVGEGVKLDAPDRPILWFSPKGDAQYQVIYADLSVKVVAESALPDLPAAAQPKSDERTVIVVTSPRVTSPQSAVKDYDALQHIRRTGRQDEVRFLELQWMHPFMESDAAADSNVDPDTSRFKFLEEFRNLEGLNVGNLFLTESDLKVIGRCHNLKKLSLSGIEIIEASRGKHRLRGTELRHLSQLTNLEMLDLSQSDFSGGLQHLGQLPKLQTLILSSFEHLNDASVAQLTQLPHLKTLVLAAVYANNSDVTVTDAGLVSLKDLPSLRTLYVDYHGNWTMPIEKLQSLLPGVDVQRGWLERTSTGPVFKPRPPVEIQQK